MTPDDSETLPFILASVSRWRRNMLTAAGLNIEVSPSGVDEDAVKESMPAAAPKEDLPLLLADYKARQVCSRFPNHLVIAADQILSCDGQRFDKPLDRNGARAQLQALRGKAHDLVTAAVVYRDGQRLWHSVDTATLTMRAFSDDFLETYLEAECPDIFDTVGGYRLEGPGVQLFAAIKGDYFTILGLPLLKILAFLRQRGDLAS
jgi:septum formation protein